MRTFIYLARVIGGGLIAVGIPGPWWRGPLVAFGVLAVSFSAVSFSAISEHEEDEH